MSISDLWALVLMAGGGIVLWHMARRHASADSHFVARVVAATVAVRGAWSFFQHNIIGQYYSLFGADTLYTYSQARLAAEAWKDGMPPMLPTSLYDAHMLMVFLKTTTMVYLFGPSPMLGEAFTIVLNASICVAVFLICRHLRATSTATRMVVLLNAFLPSLVFWSTQDLKDPVLATCGMWALLAMFGVSSGKGGRLQYLMLLLCMDSVALLYRTYVGILLISGQGLAWVYTLRLPRTTLGQMTRILMFMLIAPVVMHFGVREMKDTYGEGMNLEWANDQFNTFREAGVAGGVKGSEYEIPLTASSPAIAILQLPIRILLLLLTPIPIFPGSVVRMMMFPEMWFMYLWVVPRFAKGVREAWRKNPQALMAVLLMVAPVIMAYALKTSVSGEAARMRTQFLPELLIFAGIGHAVMKRERVEAAEAFKRKLLWVEQKQQHQEDVAS